MDYLILLPIILAFSLGLMTSFIKFKNDKEISLYGIITTTIVSVVTFVTLYLSLGEHITVLTFSDNVNIGFKIDGLSVIFAAMVSVLWPLATIYASKYMTHEGKFQKFFTFYTMTFGTVLAIAFSANMLTMYLFYETLTFITLPLVTHNGKSRDIYAGNKYILYSVGGAAVSFMGMMVFYFVVGNWEFNQGGVINGTLSSELIIAYILMFIGFSVKAGIYPLHKWLVNAGVAPTTVTALLHAVAVVKSGAFAVMRTTYYLYDFNTLKGTLAQTVAMSIAIITIIFGSAMAMKSKHIKRRLAYSTVSQLSYILLGVSTMSYTGLMAALLHMVNHAFIKIVLFYGAGNVLYSHHAEYVSDVEGYGKIMKSTFFCFTLCSLSLIGVPPFSGFFSKFALAQASIQTGGDLGVIAVIALMISAVLTAMYLLQIVVLAYVPHNDFDYSRLDGVKDVPNEMNFSVVTLTVIMVIMSLGTTNLYNFIQSMIMGGI